MNFRKISEVIKKQAEIKSRTQKVELSVDDHDFEIWIHNGHEKIEFYHLNDEDRKRVFEQIKKLDQKLEEFKNYTGYHFV